MILAGAWEPSPPRPGSLDDAMSRGFDPESVKHDRANPEPLSDEWQGALEGSLRAANHLRDVSLNDDHCGERCDRCDDRMCAVVGPEPRACGTTCADCPCDCTACIHARVDLRADLMHQIEKEGS